MSKQTSHKPKTESITDYIPSPNHYPITPDECISMPINISKEAWDRICAMDAEIYKPH